MLVILIGLLSIKTFNRQSRESYWVRHTYQVITQIEVIQRMLIDMETGRRGFRSTNEKRFLATYNTVRQTIEPAVDELSNLVKDNPIQIERAKKVQLGVRGLLQFWQELGDDASRYNRQDLIRITDIEKGQMDAIRNQLVKMAESEQVLLTQREKDNTQAVKEATWSLGVGTLLILGIVIILIYLIIREFISRSKAEYRLQKNLAELEKVNKEGQEKNWLLSGVSVINASLQGVTEVTVLARTALHSIARHLNLPMCAFYVYDSDKQLLLLKAAEGLPAQTPASFALGEGLVGQASTLADLYVLADIPADYWSIQSGSGKARPGQLVFVPLWYNHELRGVLELATFNTFEPRHLDFLRTVSENIAIALNAVDAREKVVDLLEKVQEQREELVNQQEELQQTNEELVRQAEVLQSSEEELKVQEEELRQINTELEEKNEAIEVARHDLALKARELELTSQYKSEFLANMSHELRTPLNSILILAKLLSENKGAHLSDKQVEYAHIIFKSGTDLLELINDILDLAKIEAGKVELHMDQVPVKSIASDIEQLFGVVAEQKGVHWINQVDEAVPDELFTDKQRLEQVIRNLLSNSFKFTPKGGTVTLRFALVSKQLMQFNTDTLLQDDQILAISVTDTGIGIAADKQQLIFEAFQQADGATNRKFGGTGLGLSITRELIRRLGGEVRVDSELGKGSTFTLYLPVGNQINLPRLAGKEDQTPVAAPIPLPEQIVEQTQVADDRDTLEKNSKVMLIIEDDPHFAQIVRDFAREKQYKTIVALQGDEGLYYARKYRPSAITLDMQLPVISGWELLKVLKSDDTLKYIPVHVISAADERRQETKGALAYLKKPVAKEDLEKAFTLLGEQINAKVKRVLVLSGNYLKDESLNRLINDRNFDMDCDFADTTEEALQKFKQYRYDCIIADIGQDLKKGIDELQVLQRLIDKENIPVIIYLDKDLSAFDELQLKRLSDVIIQDSSQARERLMDELELFLYKIQETGKKPVPHYEAPIGDDTLHHKKVLLVDDDMRNVFALTTLLEEHQMTVLTAGDGVEALEMLDKEPDTDLVLMDIMMPEMDGYEATRRIRADHRFLFLPIIALTAKAMAGDREKSLEAGVSDYITKPVDTSKLFSLMRVWLSR